MSYRVIIVDDDPINRKIVSNILSKNDIAVTALSSGPELLAHIKENDTPDLILLDIMMEEMDGFETLAKVRELEEELDIKEIPVIFLTSDDDNESETRGFEMGVSDYIRKPFEPVILLKRINNVLKRQSLINRFQEEATIDSLRAALHEAKSKEKGVVKTKYILRWWEWGIIGLLAVAFIAAVIKMSIKKF